MHMAYGRLAQHNEVGGPKLVSNVPMKMSEDGGADGAKGLSRYVLRWYSGPLTEWRHDPYNSQQHVLPATEVPKMYQDIWHLDYCGPQMPRVFGEEVTICMSKVGFMYEFPMHTGH